MCVGKGISSTLPIAAILGSAEVLDLLSPGEVTTTHAGHPLSCAAALANLDVLEKEDFAGKATVTGETARQALTELKNAWPEHIADDHTQCKWPGRVEPARHCPGDKRHPHRTGRQKEHQKRESIERKVGQGGSHGGRTRGYSGQ